MEDIPNDLMRPKDAAALLQVHFTTLYRWIRAGLLPTFRVAGRQRRISRRDAVALIQAERIEPPADKRQRRRTERNVSEWEREKAARRDLETLTTAGLDKYL